MLMFALAIFGYFYYLYFRGGYFYLIIAIGVLLASAFSIIRKRRNGFSYFRLALLIASVGWFLGAERNIWMGILYAIAGLFEKQVKFPQEVGVSKDEIVFNSFPKRKLQWNEVSNVLIKDGVITIDQKNNKLFQKEINEGVSLHVENEFNEFCRQQLDEQMTVGR
jgi:hypothetical protein